MALSHKEYTQAYTGLTNNRSYAQAIEEAVRNYACKPAHPRKRFLDIGAGDGRITHSLAPLFDSTTAIEPNPELHSSFPVEEYELFSGSFEEFHPKEGFDCILCSHVLYHVPWDWWQNWLERIMQLLHRDGTAVLVVEAPLGNKYHRTSHDLMRLIENLPISVEVQRTHHIGKRATLPKMRTLCHFLVHADCFTEEEYASLSHAEKDEIEQAIERFAQGCSIDDGNHLLRHSQDILVLRHKS